MLAAGSIACFAFCALAPALDAQTEPEPAKGSRVRIVMLTPFGGSNRYVPGALVRLGGDTMILAVGTALKDTAVYQLGPNSPWRLERLVNRRGHPWEGVLLGTLAGVAAGVRCTMKGDLRRRHRNPSGFASRRSQWRAGQAARGEAPTRWLRRAVPLAMAL